MLSSSNRGGPGLWIAHIPSRRSFWITSLISFQISVFLRVTSTLDLLAFVAASAVATSLVVDCDGCSVETVEADALETGGVGTAVAVILDVMDLATIFGAGFALGVATGVALVLGIGGAVLPLVAGVGVGLALGVGAVLVFGMVKAGGGATAVGDVPRGCWPAIADLLLAAGGVCFLAVVETATAVAALAARVARGVIGASASNTEFEPVSEWTSLGVSFFFLLFPGRSQTCLRAFFGLDFFAFFPSSSPPSIPVVPLA